MPHFSGEIKIGAAHFCKEGAARSGANGGAVNEGSLRVGGRCGDADMGKAQMGFDAVDEDGEGAGFAELNAAA